MPGAHQPPGEALLAVDAWMRRSAPIGTPATAVPNMQQVELTPIVPEVASRYLGGVASAPRFPSELGATTAAAPSSSSTLPFSDPPSGESEESVDAVAAGMGHLALPTNEGERAGRSSRIWSDDISPEAAEAVEQAEQADVEAAARRGRRGSNPGPTVPAAFREAALAESSRSHEWRQKLMRLVVGRQSSSSPSASASSSPRPLNATNAAAVPGDAAPSSEQGPFGVSTYIP